MTSKQIDDFFAKTRAGEISPKTTKKVMDFTNIFANLDKKSTELI